jgi:acetyl-CoA carboxylase biotin carboxylase subunit
MNFLPSPGKILHLREPSGPGVRLDSGVYPGWTVPMEYDPLLAKLAVWAEDRPSAIARLERAIHEYSVVGVKTNLSFFRRLLADPEFAAGRLHTGFIDEFFARQQPQPNAKELLELAAYTAARHVVSRQRSEVRTAAQEPSRWRAAGLQELMR